MGDPRSLLICKVFETLILNLSLPTSDIALFSRRGVLQNKECLKSSLAAVEERLNGWIASIRDADKYEKTGSTIFDTDSHFMSFIGVINGNNFTDYERRVIIQSLDQSNLTSLTNNIRVLQSHINIWKTEVNGATPTEVNGATHTEVNGATPKRPIRDDKMFYPPGSHGYVLEAAAAAQKLKLEAKAIKAAEISQSSREAAVNNNEPIDTNAVVGGARRRKLSASKAPVKRVTPKKKGRRAKRRSELDL